MDPLNFGVPPNTWAWSPDAGYDLSRGALEATKTIKTQKGPVKIDPARSALVVIDNQNYFLHPAFRDHTPGLKAMDKLIKHAIPSARSAGVKVLWVNWGLTDNDIISLPPCHAATFGGVPKGKNSRGLPGGLGADLGTVKGIAAGRRLMRGTWNAELYGPLKAIYEEGEKDGTDVWIHKNRMSAMWGGLTLMEQYLKENGIETLFFTGVNTDQCVWGTLIDAHNKGYDTCLIKDCAATNSPKACIEATEYNTDNVGFICTAQDFEKGLKS